MTPTTAQPDLFDPLVELALLPPTDIPEPARRAALRTIVNSASLSVGAAGHEVIDLALRAMSTSGAGGSPATVLGRSLELPLRDAALVNGISAHVEDFDDTHLATVIHPGCAIVPAAVAAAEVDRCSGRELLDAVAVGVEVTLRLGLALGSDHFDRGWHLTSSTGRVGAAVAVARLRGLDRSQLRAAVVTALGQVAGTQAALGTMTKSFHAGKAASDGLEAAMAAAAGLAPDAELATDLLHAITPSLDVAKGLEGLGERWEVVDNAIKPYSCGIVSHAVVDAGIELRQRIEPHEVEEAVVTVNPVVLDVMGVQDPQNGLQSKFSVYHCFALGLTDQKAGPPQFSDERARADDVVRLRDLLRVDLDPAIARDECRLRARVGDTWHDVHVPHATASVARPMTDDQLDAKCFALTAPRLGDDAARRLLDALFDLDGAADVAAVVALARPA